MIWPKYFFTLHSPLGDTLLLRSNCLGYLGDRHEYPPVTSPTPLKIEKRSGHHILILAQGSNYSYFLILETPSTLEKYFLGTLGSLHESRPV